MNTVSTGAVWLLCVFVLLPVDVNALVDSSPPTRVRFADMAARNAPEECMPVVAPMLFKNRIAEPGYGRGRGLVVFSRG